MLRIVPTLLGVLLLGGVLASPALAQIPAGVEGTYEPHPEARRAISQLLSPYCPGFMLEVCPSSEAQALRDSIHTRAMEGASSGELVEWMLSQYGEEYRGVPQSRGSGLFAWILPPLALLMGVFGVVMALRRFRPSEEEEAVGSAGGNGGGDDPVSPEVEARLREAIRELELSEDPL